VRGVWERRVWERESVGARDVIFSAFVVVVVVVVVRRRSSLLLLLRFGSCLVASYCSCCPSPVCDCNVLASCCDFCFCFFQIRVSVGLHVFLLVVTVLLVMHPECCLLPVVFPRAGAVVGAGVGAGAGGSCYVSLNNTWPPRCSLSWAGAKSEAVLGFDEPAFVRKRCEESTPSENDL